MIPYSRVHHEFRGEICTEIHTSVHKAVWHSFREGRTTVRIWHEFRGLVQKSIPIRRGKIWHSFQGSRLHITREFQPHVWAVHHVFLGSVQQLIGSVFEMKNDKYCCFYFCILPWRNKILSLRNRFSLRGFLLDHWSKISVLFLCVHGCYKFLSLKFLTKRENLWVI